MIDFHEIRGDNSAEIESLAKFAGDIWREHFTPIIGSAQVEYMLKKFQSPSFISEQIANKHYRYFMTTIDDIPAGYFAIVPHHELGKLFLSKLYTSKDMRGKGAGMAMLKKAQEIAETLSLKSIYLQVNKHNTNSIAFYKSRGFEIVESIIADIGNGYVMDDYVMEKTI